MTEPPEPATTPDAALPSRSLLWRDLSIVGIATVIVWVLASTVDFSEQLLTLTRANENLQLDEVPGVLIFLSASLAWLTWRRYREAEREIVRRRAAERKLAEILVDNRRLAQGYLEVQESERRRLAHELHDELGQYLNAIKIDAVALRNSPTVGEHVRAEALGIVRNVDHVHTTVRDMMRRLRPVGLDELGLGAALEQCVDTWRERCPETRFTLDLAGDLDALGEALNLTVFRFVQEGLTNATRHAEAREVHVRVIRPEPTVTNPDTILAELSDDGRGADLALPRHGLGLVGMRERIGALGGTLAIETAPGRGFRVVATIPVSAAESSAPVHAAPSLVSTEPAE